MTRQQKIQTQLHSSLNPVHLTVVDESHRHRVPVGAESHFKILVVSQSFEGMHSVERHRKIYDLLKNEFVSGLHALTLRTLTPEQWKQEVDFQFESPPCSRGIKSK